jgi:propionyl-CoA carboxylase beta chain
MGAEGAIEILFRRELQGAKDRDAYKKEKVAEYRDRFASPYVAAEYGFIDGVIEPADTRHRLIAGLRLLETKVDTMPPKKHGNIPL